MLLMRHRRIDLNKDTSASFVANVSLEDTGTTKSIYISGLN